MSSQIKLFLLKNPANLYRNHNLLAANLNEAKTGIAFYFFKSLQRSSDGFISTPGKEPIQACYQGFHELKFSMELNRSTKLQMSSKFSISFRIIASTDSMAKLSVLSGIIWRIKQCIILKPLYTSAPDNDRRFCMHFRSLLKGRIREFNLAILG